ncbi:MAG: TAT-variant-translocated molybdopterin oxidoreductase [Phycisphaerales bacterium]
MTTPDAANPRAASTDLESLRRKLEKSSGPTFWRSLDEIADTDEFRAFLHHEFPAGATEWHDGPSRRSFLRLMAASFALAGLHGCRRQPPENIVANVRDPENAVPGKPEYYATACTLGGFANGVLVESHDYRPTKIEGNPLHPASLGATDARTQADVLTVYDPNRSQSLRYRDGIRTWDAFVAEIRSAMAMQRSRGGAGLRILTETVTSPTFGAQIAALRESMPNLRWYQYEPVNRDAAHAAARRMFGRIVDHRWRIDRARRLVSLDSDFMMGDPGAVRYAREFADGRRVRRGTTEMNRLYVIESQLTVTGASADHRLGVAGRDIPRFAAALAARLGLRLSADEAIDASWERWIDAIAADLDAHRGESLVIPGFRQPPVVHMLAHAINESIGAVGATLEPIEPVALEPAIQGESLASLTQELNSGAVEVLLILGGNPVYTAPADLEFGDAIARAGLSVRQGLFEDETSERCDWHVPASHELEMWSDARAFDGTPTILQPLMRPLYFAKSAHEMLAMLTDESSGSGYEIVREHWRVWFTSQGGGEAGFEDAWRTWLHDGVVPGAEAASAEVSAIAPERWDWNFDETGDERTGDRDLEVQFAPDPSIWDGRYSNNGWLQELPKPLTKLTWSNAAIVSPTTAERLGLRNEEVVRIEVGDRVVEGPVWITPGQPDQTILLSLGYGRREVGPVGRALGVDAYRLRTVEHPWFAPITEIRRVGRVEELACTQEHHSMEGRHLIRVKTIDEFEIDPSVAIHAWEEKPLLSLYPGGQMDARHQWGMSIDLTACIGCNACVVACQAENNIPVVGPEEVRRGREMHWIRVDRYFEGDPADPHAHLQPVPCMHCENAPCEVVCPVGATVHDEEGLNEMVYNRCVGTRYCSNNCPYKVRRFNFLQYVDPEVESLKLQRNPDVTVRSRGVMEKCTYCIQRINSAKIEARKRGERVADGAIQTACQQVCPTRAIIFGDVSDPSTEVSRLKAQPHDYGLLTELTTKPRTTYLARVQNLNPALAPARSADPAHANEHEEGHRG